MSGIILLGVIIMSGIIAQRLQDLNIILPKAGGKPLASYVPFVRSHSLVFISGQIPIWNGEIRYQGQVGLHLSLEQAKEAAKLCALNIIAHLKQACLQDLDQARCLRLEGFINARADFVDHPQVMDGASELIVSVFSEEGFHTRLAVGVSSLPLNVPVEIGALFEVKTFP